MTTRRPLLLMAVLLVLVSGYVLHPFLAERFGGTKLEPPLPGKNSISNLVVRQNKAGNWKVSFDYFYTGEPRGVVLSARVTAAPQESAEEGRRYSTLPVVERGAHSATVSLFPMASNQITRHVIVRMTNPAGGNNPDSILASAVADQLIQWPSWEESLAQEQYAQHSPQENLERAIELIDGYTRDGLERARAILERLIKQDPSLVQGYVQLARVEMKTNWGPEGLHSAEGLLTSALQLEPDDANANIVMGYVYTHQQRYAAAQKLFEKAAASNPRNLWLWTNWGELLALQGKSEQAAAKYREAIERPMTHDTYDYARADAYRRLLALLQEKEDLDAMEQLYTKAVGDFGDNTCYGVRYAEFLLLERGDAVGAIERAHKALEKECGDTRGRDVVGLGQYMVWAKGAGAERAEALNQARIYLPAGPRTIYLLARSDKTMQVAQQLLAAGEKIDQLDNEKLNALAHAMRNDDLSSVRRLLHLGAQPETPVGYDDMPVALLPVVSGNLEMVKLLQQSRVNYAKLRYRGATALDYAKQTGDADLSALLSQGKQTL